MDMNHVYAEEKCIKKLHPFISHIQLIQTQSNIILKHNTDTYIHLDDEAESEDTTASKINAAITFASPFIYFLFSQNQ